MFWCSVWKGKGEEKEYDANVELLGKENVRKHIFLPFLDCLSVLIEKTERFPPERAGIAFCCKFKVYGKQVLY